MSFSSPRFTGQPIVFIIILKSSKFTILPIISKVKQRGSVCLIYSLLKARSTRRMIFCTFCINSIQTFGVSAYDVNVFRSPRARSQTSESHLISLAVVECTDKE